MQVRICLTVRTRMEVPGITDMDHRSKRDVAHGELWRMVGRAAVKVSRVRGT